MPRTDAERRAYDRKYYRKHPEVQATVKASNKRVHQKNSVYPEYKQVVQARKKIYSIRESYKSVLAHAERLERRLARYAGVLLKHEQAWAAVREQRDRAARDAKGRAA